MRGRYAVLVAAMIVAGSPAAAGGLGGALELLREGLPASAVAARGFEGWFWPLELWGASAWSSRRLLGSGRPDAAALVALLPLASILAGRLITGA